MSCSERNLTLYDLERSNRNSILPNIGEKMSDTLSLIVRTVDKTRKSVATLPSNLNVEQLVSRFQQEWQLPSDVSYKLRLERTGQELDSSKSLASAGVRSDDVLDLLPIMEHGQL
jgi:hypothetical protein